MIFGGYKMFDEDEWDRDARKWREKVDKEQEEWSKKVAKQHKRFFDEFNMWPMIIFICLMGVIMVMMMVVWYCRRSRRRGRVLLLSRASNTTLPAAYPQQQYTTVTVTSVPIVFRTESGPRPAPPPAGAAAPRAPDTNIPPPSYEQVVAKYPPYNPANHPL